MSHEQVIQYWIITPPGADHYEAIKKIVEQVIDSEGHASTDKAIYSPQYIEYTVFLTWRQEKVLQKYWGVWLYGPTEQECLLSGIENT